MSPNAPHAQHLDASQAKPLTTANPILACRALSQVYGLCYTTMTARQTLLFCPESSAIQDPDPSKAD